MKNTRPDAEDVYVIRNWIPQEKLNVFNFNKNFSKGAVDFLKKNPNFINYYIYKNPYAMDIILERIKTETDNDYIEYLCENPEAIDIIENFINTQKEIMPALMEEYENDLNNESDDDDDDYWGNQLSSASSPEEEFKYLLYYLSKNPKAIPLLKKYPEFINYYELYDNHSREAVDYLMSIPDFDIDQIAGNPFAIEMIKYHFKTISFNKLSSNPEAIFILLANQHLINWEDFSKNTSIFAIRFLKKNIHRIYFYEFSKNPSAIYLLEKHPNLIHYGNLSLNPNIFVINNRAILEHFLSRKQKNQFAWEYPRKYLVLRRFVDLISETFYNPAFKWCQKLLLKQF